MPRPAQTIEKEVSIQDEVSPREVVAALPESSMELLLELGHPDDYGFLSFKTLAKMKGLSHYQVAKRFDLLKAFGLVQFGSGLTTEDGEFRGSGYALSPFGREVADYYEDQLLRSEEDQPMSEGESQWPMVARVIAGVLLGIVAAALIHVFATA